VITSKNIIALVATLVAVSGTIQAKAAPWAVPKPDYDGAEPLNKSKWFTFNDYPEEAVRNGQQGLVIVSFEVDLSGRAQNCRVMKSTGFRTLDELPCRLIIKRARFKPAVTAEGVARVAHATSSMSFWMP
jgi:TonB family protein